MISSICIRGIATYPKDAETRIDGLRKQCLFFVETHRVVSLWGEAQEPIQAVAEGVVV